MTNEWRCLQCNALQTTPSRYSAPGVGDFCSPECMDKHGDELGDWFDALPSVDTEIWKARRMQVFDNMRAAQTADEFSTPQIVTNERGLPIAIRQPLAELEALRAENARLLQLIHEIKDCLEIVPDHGIDHTNSRFVTNTVNQAYALVMEALKPGSEA